MTQNRLPDPPQNVAPGELVLVRVGDQLYVYGEHPEGPSPRFWRVCTPDTPETTTSVPETTTTVPEATTTTRPATTTSVTLPPMSPPATIPATTVHVPTCSGNGWWYDGTDPAPCATSTTQPHTPPRELADTGGTLNAAGIGGLLLAAGVLVTWATNRFQRRNTV